MGIENQIANNFKRAAIDAGFAKSQNMANAAFRAISNFYDDSKDEMYAKEMKISKTEYQSRKADNEFYEVAFDNRASMQQFVKEAEMQGLKSGVDFVVSPVKLNNQFTINMNAEMTVTKDSASTVFKAQEFVDKYKETYGNETVSPVLHRAQRYDDENDSFLQRANLERQLSPTALFERVEGVGDVVRFVESANRELDRYTIDNVNSVFSGKMHSGFENFFVLHGDTVVGADGRIVTGNLEQQILNDYTARLAAARDVESAAAQARAISYGSKGREEERIFNHLVGQAAHAHDINSDGKQDIFIDKKKIEEQARAMIDAQYYQVVAAKDPSMVKSELGYADNTLDKVAAMINKAKTVDSIKTTVDTSPLIKEDWDKLNLANLNINVGGTTTLTFQERKEILQSIRSFEGSFYSLKDHERSILESFGKDTERFIKSASKEEKAVLIQKLKSYSISKNIAMTDKLAIDNLLKNHTALSRDLAELEKVNLVLKSITSPDKRAELLALQATLSDRINKYNINEAELQNIVQQMIKKSEANKPKADSAERLRKIFAFTAEEEALIRAGDIVKGDRLSKALEKDFGISVDSYITRENLAEMRIGFIERAANENLRVVDRLGNIDTNAVRNLTERQLKAMGVSNATRDAVLLTTDKKTFGNTEKDFAILAGLGTKVLQKAVSAAQDEDVSNLYNYGGKVVKYTKQSYKFVMQNKDNINSAVDVLKMRFPHAGEGSATRRVTSSARKAPATVKKNVGQISKSVRADSLKAIDKQRRGLARLNKKENSIIAKAEKKYRSGVSRVALQRAKFLQGTRIGRGITRVARISDAAKLALRKVTGKVALAGGKVIVIAGAVLVKILCIICAFMCIYMLINSLANFINAKRAEKFNSYAPVDYGDTVAYNLYAQLKDREDAWVNHLGDYEGAYQHTVNGDLRLGEDYDSVENYVSHIAGIDVTDDGTLVINPFFTKSGAGVYFDDKSASSDELGEVYNNVDSRYVSKVIEFDGESSTSVGTNDNIFSRTSGRTIGGYIPNIETGHTSNIKDIICMTDIMYNCEMERFYNIIEEGGATLGTDASGILGSSPAQLDYAHEHSGATFSNFCSRVCDRVKNGELLGLTPAGLTYDWWSLQAQYEGSSQSYATVMSYAQNLFDNSHQEQWYLDVNFYNDKLRLNRDNIEYDDDGNLIIINKYYDYDTKEEVELTPEEAAERNHVKFICNVKGVKAEEVQISKDKVPVEDQRVASYMGQCINPVTNKFKLLYEDKKVDSNGIVTEGDKTVHVYGETALGTKFYVDGDTFPITIDIEKNISDPNDKCISEDWAGNPDSFHADYDPADIPVLKYIYSDYNDLENKQSGRSHCWTQDVDTDGKPLNTTSSPKTATVSTEIVNIDNEDESHESDGDDYVDFIYWDEAGEHFDTGYWDNTDEDEMKARIGYEIYEKLKDEMNTAVENYDPDLDTNGGINWNAKLSSDMNKLTLTYDKTLLSALTEEEIDWENNVREMRYLPKPSGTYKTVRLNKDEVDGTITELSGTAKAIVSGTLLFNGSGKFIDVIDAKWDNSTKQWFGFYRGEQLYYDNDGNLTNSSSSKKTPVAFSMNDSCIKDINWIPPHGENGISKSSYTYNDWYESKYVDDPADYSRTGKLYGGVWVPNKSDPSDGYWEFKYETVGGFIESPIMHYDRIVDNLLELNEKTGVEWISGTEYDDIEWSSWEHLDADTADSYYMLASGVEGDGQLYDYDRCYDDGDFDDSKYNSPSAYEREVGDSRFSNDGINDLYYHTGVSEWKVTLCITHKTSYTRNCQGHNFTYCGGHVGCHCHGTVYSSTNEQIYAAGLRDEDTMPIADDLDTKVWGNIEGKVNKSRIDNTTISSAINTSKSKAPWQSPQGSYFGNMGLNLKTDGEGWATGGIDNSRLETAGARLFMRDIFDIDMGVLYGSDQFPCAGKYEKFDSWTSDNMSLVIGHMTADWYDIYGFDIPLEIGENIACGVDESESYSKNHLFNLPLSQQDIEKINEALLKKYGASYTYARQKAVKRALGWVGRAHAETDMGTDKRVAITDSKGKIVDYETLETSHAGHCFLCESEEGINKSVTLKTKDGRTMSPYLQYGQVKQSCVSGDEFSFIDYLRKKSGEDLSMPTKTLVRSSASRVSKLTGATVAEAYSSALPADYIASRSTVDLDTLPIDTYERTVYDTTGSAITENGFSLDVETLQYNGVDKYHACVFIGMTDYDICLSSGQWIKAGEPITVDMTTLGQYTYIDRSLSALVVDEEGEHWTPVEFRNGARNIGGVYLHASNSTDTDYWLRMNRTNYYWVRKPDKCETVLIKFYDNGEAAPKDKDKSSGSKDKG